MGKGKSSNEMSLNDRLLSAAGEGDIGLLKRCIAEGASLNYQDENQFTAFASAICRNHVDIVQYLLELGIDPNQEMVGFSALHLAAMNRSINVMKILLESGAEPDKCNEDHRTALHMACSDLNYDMAKLLLEHGASHNIHDNFDFTPIHCTLSEDEPDESIRLIQLLLDAGGDIDSVDDENNSILTRTLGKDPTGNFFKIFKFLLEKGANPNLLDRFDQSILDIAMQTKNSVMIDHLKSNGAKTAAEIHKVKEKNDGMGKG